MGDTVGQPVTFTVAWAGCPDEAQIRLIADGRLLEQLPAGERGAYEWAMVPEQAHWVLVEVRDGSNGMLAVCNPIFMQIATEA